MHITQLLQTHTNSKNTPKIVKILRNLLLASGIIITINQGKAHAITLSSISCTVTYSKGTVKVKIDPNSIEAFQLDVSFDPARLSFDGIEYLSPYIQSASPDTTQLNIGLLQNIAGFTTSPPLGSVDIFTVRFNDLNPNLPPEQAVFDIFASSNDFITLLDQDTGKRTTLRSNDIIPCNCHLPQPVPEPSSMLGILTFGIFSAGLILKRKLKEKKLVKLD